MRPSALACALLLAGGCGPDARETERACGERLAAALDRLPASGDLAASFAAARDRIRAVDMRGCSDGRRHSADALASVTGRIAERARGMGDLRTFQQRRSMTDPAFLELMSLIEGFENRRRALIDDLRQAQSKEN